MREQLRREKGALLGVIAVIVTVAIVLLNR